MGIPLRKVIEVLSAANPGQEVSPAFGKPQSYRGYYEQIAFEPERSASVGSMLAHAKSAVGATFQGYKGGDYGMDEDSICVVSSYGTSSGPDDTSALVDVLLAAARGGAA